MVSFSCLNRFVIAVLKPLSEKPNILPPSKEISVLITFFPIYGTHSSDSLRVPFFFFKWFTTEQFGQYVTATLDPETFPLGPVVCLLSF